MARQSSFFIFHSSHFHAALLLAAVWCVVFFGFPWMAMVREQSQLFLWNGDYFQERIVVPGGLAQYVGEALVQFFYHPALAASIYLCLCALAGWLTYKLTARWWLSGVAVAVVCALAFCLQVPMTLTVALLLTLGLMELASVGGIFRFPTLVRLPLLVVLLPASYWLVGPAVALLLLAPLSSVGKNSVGGDFSVGGDLKSPTHKLRISNPQQPQQPQYLQGVLLVLVLAGCIYGSSLLTPYPLRQVVRGIDYYWDRSLGTAEEMECDFLVRLHRWDDVNRRFSSSKSATVHNAVLLARFQLHQLDERQLLGQLAMTKQVIHSQASAFLMSEVYMQLGMVQMSQRAAFEAMESIPNHGKSGRALRRLTETNLVTGADRVARKYILILEETVAYRRFAQELKPLAEDPELLRNNAYYESLRKVFQESHDAFFN